MRPGSNSLDKLRELLSGLPAVAMQFSPNSMIFTVSTADAGTIDLIRSFGVNVISSANLVARFEATWTEEQILLNLAAGKSIDSIRAAVFPEIGKRVRSGGTNEFEIQQWLMEAFRREDLIADAPPIVAVNRNNSDPHYAPTANEMPESEKEISYCWTFGARRTIPEEFITILAGLALWAGQLRIVFAKFSTSSSALGTQG